MQETFLYFTEEFNSETFIAGIFCIFEMVKYELMTFIIAFFANYPELALILLY